MDNNCQRSSGFEVLKIVAAYAIAGCLWIYLSDTLLGLAIRDADIISRLSMYKGMAFIALTSTLLYVLISRYINKITITIENLKRSQYEISRQKILMNGVIEGTTDAVYVKDSNGCYLLANSAVERFVKKPVKDVIGKDDTHIFSPSDAESIMEKDRWIMTQLVPQTYEEHIGTPAGNKCFISTKGPIFDEAGKVAGIFGVARDATEYKLAEEMLRQKNIDLMNSEAKFRSYIDKSPDGVFVVDEMGRFLEVNPAGEKMVGYSEAELLEMSFPDLLVTESIESALHSFQTVKDTGSSSTEMNYFHKNGTNNWCSVSSVKLSDSSFIAFVKDISDHIYAENVLRNKELDLEKAQLLAKTGSWTYDPVIRKSTWSKGLFHIWGLDPALGSFPVKGYHKYIDPDDYPAFAAALKDAVEIGTPYNLELRINRPDGIQATIITICKPECDDLGNVVMLRGTHQDITEQKKLEKERTKLEQQLHQYQKMEAIGQLAGGIAHDFNNKLMVIIGNSELAKMDIDDSEKVRQYLSQINQAAEQSRIITSRLLAFSRQQVISPQKLNANLIIADSLKSISRLIGEHISITITSCHDLWSVHIDPIQLDQIVMNLAINARDAMPDGGILSVETRNVSLNQSKGNFVIDYEAGDYVEISFSDTGTGMDKKTLSRIFEPFFTTKDVNKGTGLGLATVYGIISQNKGSIDVTSTPGAGTEFKVYIPRYDEPAKEIITVNDAICAGNCSILLVEDDEPLRLVVASFLRKIGYTVSEAATPTTALELVRDFSIQIDLVLTDYVMPEMNGWALMKKIREIRPNIKCIFSSGYSTDNVLLSEALHSVIIFIQKPYDFIKLSAILHTEIMRV